LAQPRQGAATSPRATARISVIRSLQRCTFIVPLFHDATFAHDGTVESLLGESAHHFGLEIHRQLINAGRATARAARRSSHA
jgi:hypothetical protein